MLYAFGLVSAISILFGMVIGANLDAIVHALAARVEAQR